MLNKNLSLSLKKDMFLSLINSINSLFPANDIKRDINGFLEDFDKGNIQMEEFLLFIRKIKKVVLHLSADLPLGIRNRSDCTTIRNIVMNALSEAVDVFEKRFNEKLPNISDSKIFVIGSRSRGYSYDNDHLFSPGRDADILIVGKGIFNAELIYVEKIDVNFGKKCRKLGFIPGDDRRFVPPVLKRNDVMGVISNIFIEGDKNLFGESKFVKVNFHIAQPNSPKIINEAKIELI